MSRLEPLELDAVLGDWLAQAAPVRSVGYLEEVLAVTATTRQRAAWRSRERWLPAGLLVQARAAARPAWIILVLALLLALVAGAIAVGSLPRVPPPYGLAKNGMVAFDSGDRIWLMNADGSDRRPVGAEPGIDTWPWWSPDGTHLAFWRALPTARWAIVVADAKGATDAIVPTNAGVSRSLSATDTIWAGLGHGAPSRLSWSPDSRRLAFAMPTRGIPGVWTVGADGTGLAQVGDPAFPADDPVWSPDGTRIAFHGGSQVAGENGVYVMRADGTDVRRVSQVQSGSGGSFVGPVWQPGGELIVFQMQVGTFGAVHVYAVRADGTGERDVSPPFADDTVADQWATWSPDGSQLLLLRATLASEASGLGRIVIVDPDGSYPVFLDTPVSINRVEWSPDGSTVMALHYDAETATLDSIVSIDVSGRSPPVAVPIENTFGGASWQRLAP